MPSLRKRDVAALALGLAVVAGLIAYVGPGKVIEAVERITAQALLLAMGLYALFFVLRGIRWRVLLGSVAPQTTTRTTTSLTAGAWMVSSYVPFKAGDVARAALLARREQANLSGVAGSVVVERALDVVGLAVIATGGLLVAAIYGGPALPETVHQAVAVAWLLPIVGLVGLFLLARWLPDGKGDNLVVRVARSLTEAADALRRDPARLIPVLLLTLLIVAAQVGVFLILTMGLLPHLPLIPLLAAVPLFVLSFGFQVTPGNVGTYEAAFVAVLALFGLGGQELIPVAVILHVLTTGIVTVLGGLALAALGTRAKAFIAPESPEEVGA